MAVRLYQNGCSSAYVVYEVSIIVVYLYQLEELRLCACTPLYIIIYSGVHGYYEVYIYDIYTSISTVNTGVLNVCHFQYLYLIGYLVFFNLRGNIVSVISLLTRYNNLYVLIENYEKIKIEVTFSQFPIIFEFKFAICKSQILII